MDQLWINWQKKIKELSKRRKIERNKRSLKKRRVL